MDDDMVDYLYLNHMTALFSVFILLQVWYLRTRRDRVKIVDETISLESKDLKNIVREVLTNRLVCRDMIRMGPDAFLNLCGLLVHHGGLRATKWISIEEQVALFLYILGHRVTNRQVRRLFARSGEVIWRHFHNVLNAIIELEALFLTQPDGTRIPSEIFNNSKFFPFFKDCVGAIDGTHVRAKVPVADAPRYRGRKDFPTQNVLGACTFDLSFTYILPGWEGTVSDARMLRDALHRAYPLKIPQGKFYLGDAGFPLSQGVITPFRGERYHLKEYSVNPPTNKRELFNLRHASLRNVVERAFGVIKKRFPIMKSADEPNFKIKTQKKIIVACSILHNYLLREDPDETWNQDIDEDEDDDVEEGGSATCTHRNQNTRMAEELRDSIANAMWEDYITHR